MSATVATVVARVPSSDNDCPVGNLFRMTGQLIRVFVCVCVYDHPDMPGFCRVIHTDRNYFTNILLLIDLQIFSWVSYALCRCTEWPWVRFQLAATHINLCFYRGDWGAAEFSEQYCKNKIVHKCFPRRGTSTLFEMPFTCKFHLLYLNTDFSNSAESCDNPISST